MHARVFAKSRTKESHLACLEVGGTELHLLDGGMGEVEAHDSHSSVDEFLQDGKLLGSWANRRHNLGERPMAVVGGHGVAFVIAVEPNGGLEGWDGPCRDGGEGRGRNGSALARSGGKEVAAPD